MTPRSFFIPGGRFQSSRGARFSSQDGGGTLPERSGDAVRTMPGHCKNGGFEAIPGDLEAPPGDLEATQGLLETFAGRVSNVSKKFQIGFQMFQMFQGGAFLKLLAGRPGVLETSAGPARP